MKSRMVSLVAIVLVAMLALGMSYALWSTHLYISGTIYTGTVSAEIIAGNCYDDEPPEKDVSDITCEVVDNTLVVTITNAYPCINYSCKFYVNNTGTIPVKVQEIAISGDAEVGYVTVTVTGIEVGKQLEPGEEVECLLTVHLENSAAQNATYTFEVDICLVQWNEYAP